MRKSLWDADHILPVTEGGGECDLDNIRTLCLRCHRVVTAQLRERIRRAKVAAMLAAESSRRSFEAIAADCLAQRENPAYQTATTWPLDNLHLIHAAAGRGVCLPCRISKNVDAL